MGTFRLILAITIILGHIYAILGMDGNANFEFLSSPIAFQSFFIVSGFFISVALNEKYKGPSFTYVNFVKNRVLRIFPLYWACILMTIVISLLYKATSGNTIVLQPMLDHFRELGLGAKTYVIWSNLFIFGQEWVFFLKTNLVEGGFEWSGDFPVRDADSAHLFLLISQAWAISFIMYFYLLAPFIVRKSTWLIVGLIVLTQGFRFYFFSLGYDQEPWHYRFFPFEFGMFLIGALGYKVYAAIKHYEPNKPFLLGFFVFFLILCCTYKFIPTDYRTKQWVFYGFLVIAMPLLFRLTKDWKWDNFLAELSFPLYLSHFVIIHLVGQIIGLGDYLLTLLILAVIVMVSLILLLAVVMPLERYRKKLSKFRL